MYSSNYQNYLVLTVVRTFCGVCVYVHAHVCVTNCCQWRQDAAPKHCCLATEHVLISGLANFQVEGQ